MSAGAFFDLDGTLLPSPSLEQRLFRWLLWRRELSGASLARWLAAAARRAGRGLRSAVEENKCYLAGVRWSAVEAWLESFRRHPVPVLPAALERLRWHISEGHRVFLVSGTLAPLARAAAEQLPCAVEIRATEVEVAQGVLTGRIAGPLGLVSGPAKAWAVTLLARAHAVRLEKSYAYGDSAADRWMLDCVGNPVAVNPDRGLARIARRRGWPVLDWRRRHAADSGSAPDAEEGECLSAT